MSPPNESKVFETAVVIHIDRVVYYNVNDIVEKDIVDPCNGLQPCLSAVKHFDFCRTLFMIP